MIEGINHITLACKDIEKSFYFYCDILNFKPLVKWDKGAYFLAGEDWFCLNVDNKRKPSPCYTHYTFSVTSENFNAIVKKLKGSGAESFQNNISPGQSFYFFDPDGLKLEIHTGDWKKRIYAKKINIGQWQNVEWFI